LPSLGYTPGGLTGRTHQRTPLSHGGASHSDWSGARERDVKHCIVGMNVAICLRGTTTKCRSMAEHDEPTGRTKNGSVVEKARRRDVGYPDLGDRMFGVGDIDFVHTQLTPQSVAICGTVTAPSEARIDRERPSYRNRAHDSRHHRRPPSPCLCYPSSKWM